MEGSRSLSEEKERSSGRAKCTGAHYLPEQVVLGIKGSRSTGLATGPCSTGAKSPDSPRQQAGGEAPGRRSGTSPLCSPPPGDLLWAPNTTRPTLVSRFRRSQTKPSRRALAAS